MSNSSELPATNRDFEWVLAIAVIILSVGFSIYVWFVQSLLYTSPNEAIWPMPALVLIEIAVLEIGGGVSIILDNEGNSSLLGRAT